MKVNLGSSERIHYLLQIDCKRKSDKKQSLFFLMEALLHRLVFHGRRILMNSCFCDHGTNQNSDPVTSSVSCAHQGRKYRLDSDCFSARSGISLVWNNNRGIQRQWDSNAAKIFCCITVISKQRKFITVSKHIGFDFIKIIERLRQQSVQLLMGTMLQLLGLK